MTDGESETGNHDVQGRLLSLLLEDNPVNLRILYGRLPNHEHH